MIGIKKSSDKSLYKFLILNLQRSLIVFLIDETLLISFSYTPRINATVAPDNPGIILAIPIKIPKKCIFKYFQN